MKKLLVLTGSIALLLVGLHFLFVSIPTVITDLNGTPVACGWANWTGTVQKEVPHKDDRCQKIIDSHVYDVDSRRR